MRNNTRCGNKIVNEEYKNQQWGLKHKRAWTRVQENFHKEKSLSSSCQYNRNEIKRHLCLLETASTVSYIRYLADWVFWSSTLNVNRVRKANVIGLWAVILVKTLPSKIELKETDTNHWHRWVSTDLSSPNVDAVSSSKQEFASREEGNISHLDSTASISK